LVGNALLVHLVAVVGHDHFTLAEQLPLVAVRRAVVDVHHVGGGHAVGVRLQGVVGQRRQATHATLAAVEAPCLAGGQHLVEAVLHHQGRTGQLGRGDDLVLVVVQGVVQLGRGHAGAVVDEVDFPVELEQVVAAVGQYCRLVEDHAQLFATVAGDVVPDDFQAVPRDGEGRTAAPAGRRCGGSDRRVPRSPDTASAGAACLRAVCRDGCSGCACR